jgi:hypothetical protein
MEKIPRNIIELYQKEFMDKKIQFTDESGERFVGTCQYLDYNPNFPTWNLQVTVDRRPVKNVKLSTIKLFENKKTFK